MFQEELKNSADNIFTFNNQIHKSIKMKAEYLISRHEKAIRILELIIKAEKRMFNNYEYALKSSCPFEELKQKARKEGEALEQIIIPRLRNYYLNLIHTTRWE